VEEREVERGLEALDLSAEVVPVDAHVQAADQVLPAFFYAVGGFGEEDEAGAGAPCWLAVYPVIRSWSARRLWGGWGGPVVSRRMVSLNEVP